MSYTPARILGIATRLDHHQREATRLADELASGLQEMDQETANRILEALGWVPALAADPESL